MTASSSANADMCLKHSDVTLWLPADWSGWHHAAGLSGDF